MKEPPDDEGCDTPNMNPDEPFAESTAFLAGASKEKEVEADFCVEKLGVSIDGVAIESGVSHATHFEAVFLFCTMHEGHFTVSFLLVSQMFTGLVVCSRGDSQAEHFKAFFGFRTMHTEHLIKSSGTVAQIFTTGVVLGSVLSAILSSVLVIPLSFWRECCDEHFKHLAESFPLHSEHIDALS